METEIVANPRVTYLTTVASSKAQAISGDPHLTVTVGAPGSALYDFRTSTIQLSPEIIEEGGDRLARAVQQLAGYHQTNIHAAEQQLESERATLVKVAERQWLGSRLHLETADLPSRKFEENS